MRASDSTTGGGPAIGREFHGCGDGWFAFVVPRKLRMIGSISSATACFNATRDEVRGSSRSAGGRSIIADEVVDAG